MKKLLLTIMFLILPWIISAQVNITADITSNTTWSSENIYMLDGLIFVDSSATLTIEAGTVIKAKLQSNITTGDGASALVVRRGGKIIANGNLNQPIIFTSELDDVNNPNDLTADDNQLWGGVILLGRATTNQPTTENQIEGIPTTENARFGGNDDSDNSGVLRFVSIRHGGFSISGVPGDEINGLTMGAVGSGTTIEFVEVFANFDDGYEWFGGTVNTRYLVSAFCGDDAFDWDMGFRGKGQYWFAIQKSTEAGRGGELDGGDDCETCQPYGIPMLSNITWIGSGAGSSGVGGDGNDRALYFRDNSGGKLWNSIITDFVASSGALDIEDLASGEDSRARLDAGELVIQNNYWWGFSNGNTLASVAPQSYVQTHLTANTNTIADPQLRGISRTNNAGLDPRPQNGAPTTTGAINPPDPWFQVVPFYGAFDPANGIWTEGWTSVSQLGFTPTTNFVSGVEEDQLSSVPSDYSLSQNFPNPFNPSTKIQFSIPNSSEIKLSVYNILGQEVAVLVNGFRNAGTYEVNWEASDMPSGVYIYAIQSGNIFITKKMTLLK
ncbi:MAG: T9SS type A sorting domain-containing protein [Ignavibacteriales bacterium]|nr:MAG: T9SS type A sorting domain-containing protein [Ignavibacteriales bacterium]